MKKQLGKLVILLFLLTTVLIGCVESGSENSNVSNMEEKDPEDIVVGFSVGTTQEERWQREIDMAEEYADEKGFELLVQSAEEDASEQQKQVENMLSKGIDVLLISAQDSESAGSIIDSAHDEGVPVVSYDRLAQNGDLDYYVTFDTVKVGELQAESLIDEYPEGKYIWLLGGPEDFNSHLIEEGHENVLEPLVEEGDIEIVTKQWAKDWSSEEAMKHVENGLTSADNDVDAVLASNDATAGGALQALEAQGLGGEVGLSGQDADIAGVQRIVEGDQTSTVYKPIDELNQKGMDLVYSLGIGDKDEVENLVNDETDNGEKDVPSVLVDVENIDKDNMVDTIIEDDFHEMEEVYKNVPEDEWPD